MFLVQDVCVLCAAVYSCGAYSGWSIRKNRINGSFKVKSKDRERHYEWQQQWLFGIQALAFLEFVSLTPVRRSIIIERD